MGGACAFQGASFAGADLSGTELSGGGSAFQNVSLEGAKLIGAKLRFGGAGFQGVNIDGAQFQGADLSTLEYFCFCSCYFDTPPAYDGKTRFPPRFDPIAQGRILVNDKSEVAENLQGH